LESFTLMYSVIASPGGAKQSKTFCEVFNVACGSDNSILGLVDTLNKIMGKNIKPKLGPIRKGDVFKTRADISKIKSKLGFNPKVGFEEGLKKTVEWFKNKDKK
ncbi:MAG: GDP-mannose 4,6-dehydratase, partial [Candidatus Omnitrophota bacterium]|nr:GDP-mannose 4,6-dehydratase [Candidatus Omnitrophota bacterium]